jgi:hypothetical protein
LPKSTHLPQPVQRRLSGQPATGLVEHGSKGRIVAQLIVIDQVLVAEREPEDAVAQQIGDGVGNAVSEPKITEALGQRHGQPDRAVGGAKQQRTAVRRDRPPSKAPTSLRPPELPKSSLVVRTSRKIGAKASQLGGQHFLHYEICIQDLPALEFQGLSAAGIGTRLKILPARR